MDLFSFFREVVVSSCWGGGGDSLMEPQQMGVCESRRNARSAARAGLSGTVGFFFSQAKDELKIKG